MRAEDYAYLDKAVASLDPGVQSEIDGFALHFVTAGTAGQFAEALAYVGQQSESKRRGKLALRYTLLLEAVEGWLRKLAGADPGRAREVWGALADSNDAWLRHFASYILPAVVPSDRPLGLTCWRALLQDPVAKVRGAAYFALQAVMDELTPGSAPGGTHGLGWQEACDLEATFKRAEAGEVRTVPSGISGAVDALPA